jgi:hypothetical protein
MIGVLPVRITQRRGAQRAQIYFRVGSRMGTCGEVLVTFGLPSEWLWPWVLISDSSIRKNFSASIGGVPFLAFRSYDPTEPRFQAVFAGARKWFLRLDEWFRRDPLRETGSRDRWNCAPGPQDGQGKTAKLQVNFLSEAYGLTVILGYALAVARPIAI